MERISSDMEFIEPINLMWCKYKLLVQRPTQKTEMVLFEGSFDVCQYLRDRRMSNKLAQSVFLNMVKDSNMPKECPFHEGSLYFHNIYALDNLPAFLPEMDFTMFITFFEPNTTYESHIKLKGSLLESNRARYKIWP
ncbi:uncharacterized protein LOC117566581 [Drosophila albomicans]|uniref:Uncharacterized protein LOC117566581 n=1 Tax=Drosophila albomicans TaxID=7291 RepID=A0A6P8WET4_DROAB|nr:uncharacterized protein LOC117566581 [Drosophila albomicans]